MADDLITFALSWLAVGAVVWMVLEVTGFISFALRGWRQKGKELSGVAFLFAVIMVMVLWPLFGAAFVRALVNEFRGARS